jgi:hypothetical protein
MNNEETYKTQKTKFDHWVCVCLNTSGEDGFHPCDKQGNIIGRTENENSNGLYLCKRCGRIIREDTFEFVGRNPFITTSDAIKISFE